MPNLGRVSASYITTLGYLYFLYAFSIKELILSYTSRRDENKEVLNNTGIIKHLVRIQFFINNDGVQGLYLYTAR